MLGIEIEREIARLKRQIGAIRKDIMDLSLKLLSLEVADKIVQLSPRKPLIDKEKLKEVGIKMKEKGGYLIITVKDKSVILYNIMKPKLGKLKEKAIKCGSYLKNLWKKE